MNEIDEKIKPLYNFLNSLPSAPAREALNKFLREKNLKIIEPEILTKFVTKALNLYEINDPKGDDDLVKDIWRHVGVHQIASDVEEEFIMICDTCLFDAKSLPSNVKTYVPDHEALNKFLREKNLKIIEPDMLSNLVKDTLNFWEKDDKKGYEHLILFVLTFVGVTQMTFDVAKEFSSFCNTCFADMGYTSCLEKLP